MNEPALNSASLQPRPGHAQREQRRSRGHAIDTIEDATVTRKQRTAVLESGRPLEHADRQVSDDRSACNGEAEWHEHIDTRIEKAARQAFATKAKAQMLLTEDVGKATTRHRQVEVLPIQDNASRVISVVVVMKDVTEEWRKTEEIHCPYFQAMVRFNSEGFRHLLFKKWNRGRSHR